MGRASSLVAAALVALLGSLATGARAQEQAPVMQPDQQQPQQQQQQPAPQQQPPQQYQQQQQYPQQGYPQQQYPQQQYPQQQYPQQGYPPPGYGQQYPQQGYPPQQGYGYPPQQQYAQPAAPAARTENIKALWIPGLIILPLSYVLTFTIALSDFPDAGVDWHLESLIPLVGPWLMLGDSNTGGESAFSLIMGIAQLAGLIMLVTGLSVRRTVTEETAEREDRSPSVFVDVMPAAGGGMLGLTMTHF